MEQTPDERAREIIKHLRSEIEDAIACRAFLEVGNTEEAVAAFERGKGDVPILVQMAMLQRLLFTLTRMYDAARDAYSLSALSRLLKPDVRADLVSPLGREDMERADEIWRRLRKDPRVKRLKGYRNSVGAHTIKDAWPDLDWPMNIDVLGVLRDTEPMIEALAAATRISTVSLSAVDTIWRERAEAYWQRLIDTGPVAVETSE